ncbi:septal ring lytic transglycosylase RlpA family protein [Magnetovibrio sp. PR-2]|uniref:septal ring lytic transglycosylase RlpA family protein n=1 Tax=Magnetovibrio sp. PR-2 TaxID=3120356 RepID=UPI002FCDF65A
MTTNPKRILKIAAVLSVSALFLAACSETRFLMHTAKRLDKTAQSKGNYKVGKPYKVMGHWYYPEEDMSYDRTGIASWYGPNFDGKPTANGEVFDQWAVSAAHKTLPLPSFVRVTNLENGRSLVIRINDRGPFVDDRIIDLSRRSAELLGVIKKGTARVRVQIMARESKVAKERAIAGGQQLALDDSPIKVDVQQVSSKPVASQALPAPTDVKASSKLHVKPGSSPSTASNAPVISQPIYDAPVTTKAAPAIAIAPQPGLYIQAGAFSNIENAQKVKNSLKSIGHVSVTPIQVSGRELYRVRLGPIADRARADVIHQRVVQAGYANARTIVDLPVPN